MSNMASNTLDLLCTKIGHDLRTLRKARGLSQTEAANSVGVSRHTLCRIENGDMGVALGTIVALAKHYEAPASFLSIMGVEAVEARPAAMGGMHA